MILACHQPCYLPWPGFFYKALQADLLVLLDEVQFPQGTSWVYRNRIKTAGDQRWLAVPVWRANRGLQLIGDVEIADERSWRRKHLRSIEHAYRHAPYFAEHIPFFERLYGRRWSRLLDLNLEALDYLCAQVGVETPWRLGSELGVTAGGSELLVRLCEKVGADTFAVSGRARTYLDEELFRERGIALRFLSYSPSVYPQLWGDFVPNLSIIDLLFNCGPKALEIVRRCERRSTA